MAEETPEDLNEQLESPENGGSEERITHVSGMYENWFLDYASYVILERAVPYIEDGLKPVQRRILHAMKELDDGRYNKVANVIGHTMKYHPHGDASIGDALVQLGQKDLLIDCQGNWGNIYTGDSAAAPRYIEARLSKLAGEILFNAKTTHWQLSYDGRNKEPITLPVKFPLLLAQGVEGIAVGLACKILPHNFIELIDASISVLKKKPFEIYPDFVTGGMADFTKYNDGARGGKVRIRAKISQLDKNTLVITDLPFGTTTGSLIDSILAANDKEKIKIKKIEDNTSDVVEILVHLPPGISPDKTIDALYAITSCEISVSPNAVIIENDKPRFVGVSEILRLSVENTVDLLRRELEIEKSELEEQWQFSSLEKIFIEERIYRDIEECETWEAVIEAIDKGLKPFRKKLRRDVTHEDIVRLTEIRIKRISKFDAFKADEYIKGLEDKIANCEHHLANLTDYAIAWYQNLKKKYGTGRERKTEIRMFDTIEASKVVINNEKLYVNREEGFAGYGIKKDEYVCECSDIDDIVVMRADGKMIISKISDKAFVGKDILHVNVFRKNDDRTTYNVVYQDGKTGPYYVKRFAISGVIRDKEYDMTKGTKGSRVVYLSANPNGEVETLQIFLKPRPKLKKTVFEFDFGTLAIKGRGAGGNIMTKIPIRKIILKEKGQSTLSARQIWWDDAVKRLNTDGRGDLLGSFAAGDKILALMQSGTYKLYEPDPSTHFDEDLIQLGFFDQRQPVSAIYYDGESKEYMVKRFLIETTDKKTTFISEHPNSRLEFVSTDTFPRVQLEFGKMGKFERNAQEILLEEFIAVKGLKAKGKRLSTHEPKKIIALESLPEPELEEVEEIEHEDSDSEQTPSDKPNVIIDLEGDEPQMRLFEEP
ncbi:MAG TPA: DNA gyrase/topoisomerase IV subunit A [Flavobacteriales bacterium]|nr:DNA gyrase/topoisomerase IV subunit A [Flavobacteriales bacterium]HPH81771.1 DNA gyrase/topoisomerase IV subunit A [Flavobacteriales bacterium]